MVPGEAPKRARAAGPRRQRGEVGGVHMERAGAYGGQLKHLIRIGELMRRRIAREEQHIGEQGDG